ncbi:mechanosensitive ion channel family protein [Parabacteroides faecis]|uniref:mechanosensitive ion channel family protein n=1 Tax=Parabacteroides TaxID=375288 RepID=UPI000F00BE2D|nr:MULTISPECIES: mechanosensitive ion channel family protein [Parabacteroides]MBC8618024.1 mechanosensitive ion channel family protein [Parabacteroides faecis]RHR99227.1 mechanosensitive ion channel family protein [Parabacteroides sp. AF14-59]
MSELQQWINSYLIKWGLVRDSANIWDNLIVLLLVIAVTVGIDYTCRYIFLGLFKRFAKRTRNQWDDLIVERKIINKLMHLIPAILVYIMLPLALPRAEMPTLLGILQMVCSIYIVAVILRFINAALNLLLEIYNRKEAFKNKPLKGFVQIIQVLVFFVGFIIIISILIGKSPATLFAGLGASAAILMLVFKDTILGFVAGIQLSANDMLRPGDWITMTKYGADGTVIEVTLNSIKVRNFDNTITMIPPYALVSDSFQNWRGMQESGGRRVKRSINIDMNSVRFCTPEMLDKFRKISLLTEYIDTKQQELERYNKEHNIDGSIKVNGRRQTNLGVFRAYLVNYLKSNPDVNKDLTCMVRQLQPTEKGIPMELYFFAATTVWIPYEGIQSDVFDHILAVLPEFDLQVFQEVSGSDLRHLRIETAN